MDAAATLSAFGTALQAIRADEVVLKKAEDHNEWFLPALIRVSIDHMAPWFTPENAAHFHHSPPQSSSVGIVMAGNLPFVGLHDLLITLLAGHTAFAKPSRKDKVLLEALHDHLPQPLSERIHLLDAIPADKIDFLLATGSDNTARYIAHAYEEVPRMVRQNRFSVAVLKGDESPAELEGLARDVLLYHGMGCRSVSNLLVPKEWDETALFSALDQFPSDQLAASWEDLVSWENAILGMEEKGGMKNERVAVVESEVVQPMPVGKLNVVKYEGKWEDQLGGIQDKLQCVVGRGMDVEFGETQQPGLLDFADGVDTWKLLSDL